MKKLITRKHLGLIRISSYSMLAMALNVISIQASLADTELTVDTSVIDAREQELRRKEQELLQGLDLNAASVAPVAQENPPIQPAKEIIEEGKKVTVLEIQAPAPKEAPQPQAPAEYAPGNVANVAVDTVAKPAPLRELESHPAIAPKPKVTAAPYIANNRIKTHSNDRYPDGTTAKRVGSFYKLEHARNGDAISDSSKSHTVSIDQLAREARARPALLTSDMSATISNSSTVLKTGPKKTDSSLSKVPRDSEVKIDYRSGAWYRVKTDAGARGWVSGGALAFDGDVPPESTVKVSGITDNRR